MSLNHIGHTEKLCEKELNGLRLIKGGFLTLMSPSLYSSMLSDSGVLTQLPSAGSSAGPFMTSPTNTIFSENLLKLLSKQTL